MTWHYLWSTVIFFCVETLCNSTANSKYPSRGMGHVIKVVKSHVCVYCCNFIIFNLNKFDINYRHFVTIICKVIKVFYMFHIRVLNSIYEMYEINKCALRKCILSYHHITRHLRVSGVRQEYKQITNKCTKCIINYY